MLDLIKILKKHKSRLLLILILSITFFNQVSLAFTTDTFLWDQVREAKIIRNFVYNRIIPPPMPTSIGGSLSADYYYLNSFFVKIFNISATDIPEFLNNAQIFINILLLLGIYIAISFFWEERMGLTGVFLVATSPLYQINFVAWNHFLVPFFCVLSLSCLNAFFSTGKYHWLLLVLLWIAFGVRLHPSALFLLPTVFLSLSVLVYNKTISLRQLAICIILITIASIIFIQNSSFLGDLVVRSKPLGFQSVFSFLPLYIVAIFLALTSTVSSITFWSNHGQGVFPVQIANLLLIIWLLKSCLKLTKSGKSPLLQMSFVLGGSLVTGILLAATYGRSHTLYSHYLYPLAIIFIFFAVSVFSRVSRKLLFFVEVCLSIVLLFLFISNSSKMLGEIHEGSSFTKFKLVAAYISKHQEMWPIYIVRIAQFPELDSQTPFITSLGYDYYFESDHVPVVQKFSESKTLLYLCEIKNCLEKNLLKGIVPFKEEVHPVFVTQFHGVSVFRLE